MCVCSVAQSCLTLCDPMDCSLPGSSVHGILQARIPVAISYSRGSSQPRDGNLGPLGFLHWQVDSLPLYHSTNLPELRWIKYFSLDIRINKAWILDIDKEHTALLNFGIQNGSWPALKVGIFLYEEKQKTWLNNVKDLNKWGTQCSYKGSIF